MKNKVCVGLDFTKDKISLFSVIKLVSQTKDLAYCYKINPAFWLNNQEELEKVIGYLNQSKIKWIFDGKTGDVLHTNEHYAYYYYNVLRASGMTLNPYLGAISLKPFTRYGDKLNFLVCRTTNKGGEFIQSEIYTKVYEISKQTNSGLVIAANKEKYLEHALKYCPDTMILSPGIGAQGGIINISHPYIIYSASRSIIQSKNPVEALERLVYGK